MNCSAAEDGSDIWKLIHDMNCDNPDEMFIPELAERAGFFVKHEKGEMHMNAYLAKVVKEREEIAEQRGRYEEKHTFASKLLEAGKGTLEEIASLTGLTLAEVVKLSEKS